MPLYTVTVTIGGRSWTVTEGDAPVYGLADPLSIGWTIPDSEQRPGQPEPLVASVNLIVPTSADLSGIQLGTLVTIKVTFDPPKDTPDVYFVGRVAEGDSAPVDQGMLYRFTCADGGVDFSSWDIGAAPYPIQTARDRFRGYLAAAGLAAADVVLDPVVDVAGPTVDLLEQPNAASLLDTSLAHWDQLAFTGLNELAGSVFYRGILAPMPGAASNGSPYKWSIDAVPDKYIPTAETPLPGTFGPYFIPPKQYGVMVDADDRAAGVIDACYVDYEASWSAIAPGSVNRAAVTWATIADLLPDTDRVPQVTYVQENAPPAGMPPTTATRNTSVIALASDGAAVAAARVNAERLGALMQPVPANPAGWAPDTFRWLLYKDAIGLRTFPVVFPRHDATDQPTPRALRTAAYVRPIVVKPIPGAINPADPTRDWVAGQLTGVLLTIEAGRPVIDFTLAPTIPEPGAPNAGTYSWNATAGTWNAQTGTWNDKPAGRVVFRWSDTGLTGVQWAQLEPTQSWDLYRLAKGS